MTNPILDMLLAQQQAWLAEQRHAWGRMLAFPQMLRVAADTRVGTTSHEVIFEKGTIRLLRYQRATTAGYVEPVLFCYALVNRPYILDLQPGKSVVQRYLERGFDVYMIDWGVPTDDDRGRTLADYVCTSLKEIVEVVLRRHGVGRLHVLGYCMGGTMSAMFAALFPELMQTLTLLASPIDFEDRSSLIGLWADQRYFDVDAFVDANGNCPAAFLQACFLLVKPVQNLIQKRVAFYENMDDPAFLAGFFAVETWVNDNIPVAGETFRQFVKQLYQSNDLVRNVLTLGDRPVDLRRVSCPLLLLTANQDHLVPPRSTEGIRPHVGSSEVHSIAIDAGHVGLVISGKAQRALWPEATLWLADRSTRAPGAGPA